MAAPTMLAARLDVRTRELTVQRIPVPVPRPGEVRVAVGAAGVCLSDIHLIDGLLRPALLDGDEVTLGHEVAGTVETLGGGVTGVAVGARVIVQAGKVVGSAVHTMGVDYDGGWAEYLVAPAELMVPIPDSLPFDQAAIIPDAVSTPWAAIERTGQVRAGESVGVWGVGGLGAHGVQLLRLVGAAPIIAIDPLPQARERALALGADLALDPSDPGFVEAMNDATEGRRLDVAFDFAGVDAVRKQAINSLGTDGRLVLVGLSGQPVTIENSTSFSYNRRQLRGHYGSEPRHVDQLVAFARLGRLELSRSVSVRVPLAEADRAVEMLTQRTGSPIRIVLVP
ncbi:zinc-binding dehydrogenase [Sanguibacter sp. 25GB23B1]|uniref:zinc-binding dehydrogenase n=1 Tax=unclassified Sanguibacter TaxID=2645534 RepID=UPI0032AECD7B